MSIFAKSKRMDTPLSGKLVLLKSKIELLASQRDEALRRLADSEEEKKLLESEIKALKEKLHKSELDREFLQVSHKIADTPQALADARALVKGMIKRVDNAISFLMEDAQL